MKLVFATHNPNKAAEIRPLLPATLQLLTLDDIGCTEDIVEDATTLEGNAWIKAEHVDREYGFSCFADDTGLMVPALHGAPGVHSARYAGPGRDAAANTRRLLQELQGKSSRKAFFRTVIVLLHKDLRKTFIGEVHGEILPAPRGSGGFGYDPVFLPEGYDKSFAELSMEEKNAISHRARAFRKLLDYLREHPLS